MERDKNLLFGILAVQLRKLKPAQLVDAAAGWVTDPSRGLAQRLVEAKVLTDQDRRFIEDVMQRAIDEHRGDVGETVAEFGGEQQVYATFCGSLVPTSDGGLETMAAPPDALSALDVEGALGVQEPPGRYTLKAEHARGGMGRVLLVHDEHLSRDIAMKELLPELAGESTLPTPVRKTLPIVARFLQEARITGQLEHPSIVPVYELGYRRDGSLYYTMKLVRGKTLGEAIQGAKSLEERLGLLPHFVDLCNAIAYGHSRGVIHRDLKPANVMVGDFGETVVLDWGLAKARGVSDVHEAELSRSLHALSLGDELEVAKTRYGTALGTPVYMPPEQAKGELDLIDERSDVYSLGAVLYELLSGRTPFPARSLAQVLHAVINEQPERVDALDPKVPPELAAICARAMAKDPAARYQSAKRLADDIQRFQSGALVEAHQYGYRDYVGRFVKRHRAILATATAALLIIAAYVVYYGVQLQRSNTALEASRKAEEKQRLDAESALARAEQQTYLSQIHLARSYLGENATQQATQVLWETDEKLRGWEWGHLLQQSYPEQRTFNLHGDAVNTVAISKDGSKLLTASEDGTAKITDVNTGNTIAELKGHEGPLSNAVFSPDEDLVATGAWDNTVRLWAAASGKVRAVLQGHSDGITQLLFSPDSKRLISGSWDTSVRVWDVADGKEIYALEHAIGLRGKMALAANAKWLITSGAEQPGYVKFWDFETGTPSTAALWSVLPEPQVFAVSRDGSLLALANKSGTTSRWALFDLLKGEVRNLTPAEPSERPAPATNPKDELPLKSVAQDEAFVYDLAFSTDNERLVKLNADGACSVFTASSGMPKLIASFSLSQLGPLKSLDRASNRLLVAESKQASIVDLRRGVVQSQLAADKNALLDAVFSPDDKFVATAGSDGVVKAWFIETTAAKREFPSRAPGGWGDSTTACMFDNVCDRALLWRYYNVTAWDLAHGVELGCIELRSRYDWCATLSADGKRMAAANHMHTWIWNVDRGSVEAKLNMGGTHQGAFSPDNRLYLGFRWSVAEVREINTDRVLARFEDKGCRFVQGCFAKGRPSFLLLDAKGILIEAALADGKELKRTDFRKSGKNLAGLKLLADGTVVLPNREKHRNEVLMGEEPPAGPNDRRIAFFEAGRVRVYDTASGTELISMNPELKANETVRDLRFIRDGTCLAGSMGGALVVWPAPPPRLADWPGNPDTPWQGRFEEYLRKRGEAPADASKPYHRVIASLPALLSTCRAIAEGRIPPPDSPAGQAAVESSAGRIVHTGYLRWDEDMTRNLFNALLPLGIQVRDEIFAVNGKPVRTWQEFASALGEAAKLDSPEGFGTFSLGVRRNGVMREFTYYLDPAPPATEQIEMLRGTMVAYIQTLALSLLALLQPRHIETCNGDSGLTIGSAEAKNLAALNIKDGDFIARLNGKEFDSVEATLAAFNELAAQVGEKKLDSFTIEGWRGELTPLKVTVKAT